jgi:hypothetical protein
MTPFVRAEIPKEQVDAVRKELIAKPASFWQPLGWLQPTCPMELDMLIELGLQASLGHEVWMNDTYQVIVRYMDTDQGKMTHLSIKRLDKAPCRNWREFQRIKNELVGEEIEAVEIYPAESRLVDTANQYHLWCLPAGYGLGFGFDQRFVTDEETVGNSKQEPFPKEPNHES